MAGVLKLSYYLKVQMVVLRWGFLHELDRTTPHSPLHRLACGRLVSRTGSGDFREPNDSDSIARCLGAQTHFGPTTERYLGTTLDLGDAPIRSIQAKNLTAAY